MRALARSCAVFFTLSLALACGSAASSTAHAPIEPTNEATRELYVTSVQSLARPATGSRHAPYPSLGEAVAAAADGASIVLLAGTHHLQPKDFVDPTCGNCADEDFATRIETTVGQHVLGKSVHLRGESRQDTMLHTGAGYGLLFEDSQGSSIESLTITGGVRSADGKATDGAVVVRNSSVRISKVDIVDNDDLFEGEPNPIVGIAGVVAREGARVEIRDSRILNSSWDGIAAYRSAPDDPEGAPTLVIDDVEVGCTRDCIKRAGRGVGIGITWNAKATIRNAHVHDYWKGIGSFGTSVVTVENSIIRNQYGWGLVATAESTMTATNNTVTDNGTVGMAVWDEQATGAFVNNVVVGNGWNPKEWVGKKTGLWLNTTESSAFSIRHNLFWDNRPFDVCQGGTPEPEITECTAVELIGKDGNLRAQPLFAGDGLSPAMGSPLIDAGDAGSKDADGSIADLGAYGGQHSRWPQDGPRRQRMGNAEEAR